MITLVFSLFLSRNGIAQTTESYKNVTGPKIYSYNSVEEKPLFNGAENPEQNYIKLLEYVNSFQENYRENGEITIPVVFTIDQEGKCQVKKIFYSNAEPLYFVAKKIIEEMPAWKPGKQKGKPVIISYSINLNF